LLAAGHAWVRMTQRLPVDIARYPSELVPGRLLGRPGDAARTTTQPGLAGDCTFGDIALEEHRRLRLGLGHHPQNMRIALMGFLLEKPAADHMPEQTSKIVQWGGVHCPRRPDRHTDSAGTHTQDMRQADVPKRRVPLEELAYNCMATAVSDKLETADIERGIVPEVAASALTCFAPVQPLLHERKLFHFQAERDGRGSFLSSELLSRTEQHPLSLELPHAKTLKLIWTIAHE
jgi:hypothetical protein